MFDYKRDMDTTFWLLMFTTCVLPWVTENLSPLSAAVITLTPSLLFLCVAVLATRMEASSLTTVRDLTCALNVEFAKMAESLSSAIQCLFLLAGVFIKEFITCMKDLRNGPVKNLLFLMSCWASLLMKLIRGNTVRERTLDKRKLQKLSKLLESHHSSKKSTAPQSSSGSHSATSDDIWSDGVLSSST